MEMEFQKNIELARFTTFKIGGKAKFFYHARNKDNVRKAIEKAEGSGLKYFVLGGGSNILISDNGFDGLAIRYCAGDLENSIIQMENDSLLVDAGAPLSFVAGYSAQCGLSGLEWAAGIPGTIGGAIRGNAGAYGGDISQIFEMAEIIGGGKIFNLDKSSMEFGYRNSACKQNSYTILSAVIKLKKGIREESQEEVKNILLKRDKSLGIQYPSAGCIFANPQTFNSDLLKTFKIDRGAESKDNKIPAGYLIEKTGLKGKKIGGAVISGGNANFILNDSGKAKAKDVIDLIDFAKEKVREKFKIELEEEIIKIGF